MKSHRIIFPFLSELPFRAVTWNYFIVIFTFLYAAAPFGTFATSQDPFSGWYGGLQAGVISYNTQITFDGINDPAGRGGIGYSALIGYNYHHRSVLIGLEATVEFAPDPDPYTFDPAILGFSELDILRDASFGLRTRAGFLATETILLYGLLGLSVAKQSAKIDGVSLDSFASGSEAETFGALQLGGGLEWAFHPGIRLRTSFRSSKGHDLHASDFGSIPTNASLTRFDVEPRLQQFFLGLLFRF